MIIKSRIAYIIQKFRLYKLKAKGYDIGGGQSLRVEYYGIKLIHRELMLEKNV